MSSSRAAGFSPRGFATNDLHLPEVLRHSRSRLVFGPGTLSQLGDIARCEGASRILLVTDNGILATGHVDRAVASLRAGALNVVVFSDVGENPTTDHVAVGVDKAREHGIDSLVAVGGGSAMDCAKGINFIHTNGGTIADYWGINKTRKPLLPWIAVPTTAGTGSETQSFALISDPVTHQKMACGDVKAMCRVAILDPDLTRTQPPQVAAAAGIDAVAHAVETSATTKRNATSLAFTREAWKMLSEAFETAMHDPQDDLARAKMLLGAHLAGAAIERSMLGAAHACANPLTAHLGIRHGVAVGLMLPCVVRFNAAEGQNPYAELSADPFMLANRLEAMLDAARLPKRLAEFRVPRAILPTLADEAAGQWTAQFNPRPVTAADCLQIYQLAYE